MRKDTVITICKVLLSTGIYAMPMYDTVYGDWTIKVNHPMNSWICDLFSTVYDFHFVDCTYNPHDYKVQDYPVYCK